MNHNNDEHAHHAEMQETSVEELELKSWKRKLIGAWIFAVPIALLMFNQRIFEFVALPEIWMIPLLLVLGFPVVFVFGFDTLRNRFRALLSFYFNIYYLI